MNYNDPLSQGDLNDCGCCEGTTVSTPAVINNRGGLDTIEYRVGDHAQFKQSLLARLSSHDLPSLGNLKTRDEDDFTIALLDAWSTVADVLTFYQQQIANEHYLRTAKERISVLGLSRLIGYQLAAGVAANAHLVFAMDESSGAPAQTVIEAGVSVKSTPGPGEKPQTFETAERIEARPAWNAIRPRMGRRHPILATTMTIYLAGTSTNLSQGDRLLLQPDDGGSPLFRLVSSIEVQNEQGRTKIALRAVQSVQTAFLIPPIVAQVASPPKFTPAVTALLNKTVGSSQLKATALKKGVVAKELFNNIVATKPAPPAVFAFRARASIFGHNAPRWESLPNSQRFGERHRVGEEKVEYVAGAYRNRASSWAENRLDQFHNAGGNSNVFLDNAFPKIVKQSWVVLQDGSFWRSYRVKDVAEMSRSDFAITNKTTRLTLDSKHDFDQFRIRKTTVFAESEELPLAPLPITEPVDGDEVQLDGFVEGLEGGQQVIVCGEPGNDPGNRRCELAVIAEVQHETQAEGFTRIVLEQPLSRTYERETVTIHANVSAATHGETVQEVLGSGNAGQPFSSFALRQQPLTHVSAATPTGTKSTLEVRVNGLLWQQVASLFGRGPQERVYVAQIQDDRTTNVVFGDGRSGARPPTGSDNVHARYRKGSGLEGLVKANQLNLLMSPPLGVKEVDNPLAATGAADPESLADARANAPLTVLTMDRIVSLRDYEDFARSFAGVAKALASWTWDGFRRRVLLTLAGPQGAEIGPTSATHANLLAAARHAGDPLVPIDAKSYRSALFRVAAGLHVAAEYQSTEVLARARGLLASRFSFAQRDFGRPIFLSEVVAALHSVTGIVAVDINALYRDGEQPLLNQRLTAEQPAPGLRGEADAAELLTLHPDSLNDVKVIS